MRVNLDKTLYMWCGTDSEDLILEDQRGCIKGCEGFEDLGVRTDKEDKKVTLRTELIKVEQ